MLLWRKGRVELGVLNVNRKTEDVLMYAVLAECLGVSANRGKGFCLGPPHQDA